MTPLYNSNTFGIITNVSHQDEQDWTLRKSHSVRDYIHYATGAFTKTGLTLCREKLLWSTSILICSIIDNLFCKAIITEISQNLDSGTKNSENQYKDEVRPKKAQKYQIVSLPWTLISQAWNGLMRHFQCLKSSAGNPLPVEKGPGSIAPLRAELWPFKEGTRQICLKIDANVTDFVNPFSNAHISGLEWSFAKIQKPQIISLALASHRKRTQVNCTSGSWAMAVQRGYPSKKNEKNLDFFGNSKT